MTEREVRLTHPDGAVRHCVSARSRPFAMVTGSRGIPDGWTLRTILDRLADIGGDPWGAIGRAAKALPR